MEQKRDKEKERERRNKSKGGEDGAGKISRKSRERGRL